MPVCICKSRRNRLCTAHMGFTHKIERRTPKQAVLAKNKLAALDYLESRPNAFFIIEGVPGNPRKYLCTGLWPSPRAAWKAAAKQMGVR